jgi:uncharacterized membrane protein
MIEVTASVTINRQRLEVYAFWREVHNLPRFMARLASVTPLGGVRSRWAARAPSGPSAWEVEVVQDAPGRGFAWRAGRDCAVPHRGVLALADAPGDRGTEVRVTLRYPPPGGALAAAVAALFGESPRQQLRDDLRRCKQLLETGEVLRTAAAVDGADVAAIAGAGPALSESRP